MAIFKKVFSIFLRIGISIILLWFVFRQVDRRSLLEIVKNADKPLLFLAFLIYFSVYILCLFRWDMLLRATNISLPLKRVIISFAGGIFFSLFLPSTIGGDIMRSIDLAVHTKRPRAVVATVLMDRLSGYIGLAMVALLAALLGRRFLHDTSILLPLVIIIAVLIVVLLVLFNRFVYSKLNSLLHSPTAGRLREAIKNLHQEIHIFRYHKKIALYNIILSLFVQVVAPVTFYIIALSLGLKIKIIYFFIFLPIISAITLLPISIGGLGLRDATTIYFFLKVGVAKDIAFAMSLLNFLFIVIYAAIGGLIYVLTVHHRRIQSDQTPQI